MLQAKNFIDGSAVDSSNIIDVLNPATEEAFAQCHFGDANMVDAAVKAAREAFPAWAATPDEERKAMLMEIAGLIEKNMPDLMAMVTQESGKPMGGLSGIGSGMEVGGSIAWTQVNASLEIPVEVIQDNDEARVEVHRKPLGVVGSITPWNWPLMIAIWHVIPAIRTGNTVVIKPSPLTPVATSRFVELANTVLPKGVLNLVHGDSEVGAAISQHQDIDKIIFTGSTETGKHIMRSSADNLKRLTLELGGNDAGIVLPGTNIDQIAAKLFVSCFHNNGQTCAALKRLYVHESQYDEVCNALAAEASKVVVGDGMNEESQLGPLQNKNQLEIVEKLYQKSVQDNGQIICGGAKPEGSGYFFSPTVVAGLSDGDALVDEEQFGPILPVIKYSDIDEVIQRANNSSAGLGGSVWGDNAEEAQAIAQQLECGSVWINDHGAIQPDAPFGGVKQSGFGVEFGTHGLKEYTSIQTVKIAK